MELIDRGRDRDMDRDRDSDNDTAREGGDRCSPITCKVYTVYLCSCNIWYIINFRFTTFTIDSL